MDAKEVTCYGEVHASECNHRDVCGEQRLKREARPKHNTLILIMQYHSLSWVTQDSDPVEHAVSDQSHRHEGKHF